MLTGCDLPFNNTKKGGLEVISTPKATVFLNEQHLGQTPYLDQKIKPGEYTLKLVPENNESSLIAWQGMIRVSPGILTMVNRNLGTSEENSSGYVLSLEPIAEKEKARLSIISTPDSVVVSLDGEPKGFTPLSLTDVSEGEHILIISSPGFEEQRVEAKIVKGYKLSINVQLAKKKEEEPIEEKKEDEETEEKKSSPSAKPKPSPELKENNEASPEAEEIERPYIKVKDNPWGYLNVRSEPSIAGGKETVLTEVDPGDVFPFIEESKDGWFKIEYEEEKQGWISAKYATLYE